MSEETVLFTPIPECDKLGCIDCKITTLEVMDEITPSFFHCQILICRIILASFPEVIAAPDPQTEDYIHLISKKDYFLTQEIQEFLKKKKVAFSDPQPVTFKVYRECVKYTMMFRLAPLWNKFGQYLCQGKDFLSASEDLSAVQFDINIKEQQMFLNFNSIKLKVCPLKVETLGLSSSLLAEFKQNSSGAIYLGNHWAKVLPSMIKARLLKVSKHIPKSCPLRNYQLLRSHWKNMYNYILPESGEGILYYEVSFRGFPEHIFVYPDICLQSESPKMIHCKNHTLISMQFAQDLMNEVHTICGKSLSLLKFNPKEIKVEQKPSYIPAREIKIEGTNSQIHRMPSIYGSVNSKPNFVNGNFVPKLKQQTLNFPKVQPANVDLLSKPLQNSNSAITCQNNKFASKLKSPEVSKGILSHCIKSIPIQRKLSIDTKTENDNISVKSETFKDLMNLIKSNETSARKENEKKRLLVDALLQEKSDITLPKGLSPPKKRFRSFKTNPKPSLESVAKYFPVQKSTFNKPVKTESNRLHFQNLTRNK